MLNNPAYTYLTHYKLNEINKFSNLVSVNQLSSIKFISLWSVIDKSKETSKSNFYSKSLITFFLLYLLSGQLPSLIKSTSDKDKILIKANLRSKNINSFLDKFLLASDHNSLQKLFSPDKLVKDRFRTTILDLSIFTELESVIDLFRSSNILHLDIFFSHSEEAKNLILLQSLWKSK